MSRTRALALVGLSLVLALTSAASATEWPSWRGPDQNGISPDTELVSTWSAESGENLIWRADLTGRSTPVVFDGRACANGRIGEGKLRQEMVACYDAEDGEMLWEHRFTPFHTTVPWNRVGWANPTADPETGYLYVQGVGGTFLAFDRDGKIVWERSLVDDLGFFSGYGGRTQTPILDEDRLIVTHVSGSWGAWAAPRHRLFAYDKRTGELLWAAAPGGFPADMNSQSTPVVAVIGGKRMLIHGNGDGHIYALEARTGKLIWDFHLSKRAINATVLVDGDTVYAGHSEENVDEGTLGRVVAIDATGQGDVTATHERWRREIRAGFPSPTLANGHLYVVDNSANLFALDPATGEDRWTLNLGTVGKASPMVAGNTLYMTEVNGHIVIVETSETGGKIVSKQELSMPDGRYAEVYGSVAAAYGRLYFTTEEGIYCVGDKSRPFRVVADEPSTMAEAPTAAGAQPATLRVYPAESRVRPGEKLELRVEAFDAMGRSLGSPDVSWDLDGVTGAVDGGGVFSAAADRPFQSGAVVAKLGDLKAEARVRILPAEPALSEDFEGIAAGERPVYQLGALSRFQVDKDEESGNHYLVKNPSPRSIHRHNTYIGPGDWSEYTVQADLRGTRGRRKVPDMGLVNSGYILDMMGVHQQLELRSWTAVLRMAVQVPFEWETDVWYTMKLQVTRKGEEALVRGKVWPKGQPEPEAWSIEATDPLPIDKGSPGLYGYSPVPVHYDNVQVTRNP